MGITGLSHAAASESICHSFHSQRPLRRYTETICCSPGTLACDALHLTPHNVSQGQPGSEATPLGQPKTFMNWCQKPCGISDYHLPEFRSSIMAPILYSSDQRNSAKIALYCTGVVLSTCGMILSPHFPSLPVVPVVLSLCTKCSAEPRLLVRFGLVASEYLLTKQNDLNYLLTNFPVMFSCLI